MQKLSNQESFTIKSSSASYPVSIGHNIYQEFFQNIKGDCILICDEDLIERYNLDAICSKIIKIKAVEENKDLSNISNIISQAKQYSLKRGDLLVGIGGGIIQDITCFVSSIYMRGVEWIYFPTTFLGMCDSCIGGKSSINVNGIKNLAGNFYPPKQIYVDLLFSASLSKDQLDSGLCEALKICYAHRDRSIFDKCCDLVTNESDNYLLEIVNLTLITKKWFIEIDEFDLNERQLLNFGHTFGHAIEGSASYRITHGIAVGFGMLWSVYFSEILNNNSQSDVMSVVKLEQTLIGLLSAHKNLIKILHTLDIKNIFEKFTADKKHKTNQYVCILFNKKGLIHKSALDQDDQFLGIFQNSFEKLKSKFS
ncbi:MAG: 3-dehydroquinate synthase [Rickettsiales bacterium]|jgi:3-dehydroquinate synthase